MKKYLLICLLLLQACSTIHPPVEPPILYFTSSVISCEDTLAGVQYPEVVRSVPNYIGIGVFDKAFGDAYSLVKHELEAGRSLIRLHLLWYDNHLFSSKDLAFIVSESQRYEPLCKTFPGRLFISPMTEHNVKDPTPFLNAVRDNAPDCTVVNNPWKGGYTKNPLYINETHGSSVPNIPGVRFAHSDDGVQSVDTDFTKTKIKWKNAVYNCTWGRSNNLRYSNEDTASRPQRIKEAKARSPNSDYQKAQEYILTTDKGTTKVPAKVIVKSQSDYHGPGDTKGNKLLIIAPIKVSSLKLKRNGKVIGSLNYYGPFDGGGYRYYASNIGFKYGKCEVFIGNKKYADINAGFRDGVYR